MSEDKMGIVRRAVEAASGKKAGSVQEVDALDPSTLNVFLAFLHPEVEVHEDRSFPEAGVYRGREAVRDYFRGFTAEFDEFRFEIEDVIDAGNDDVLVLMHLRGRGKGSGAPFDARPGVALQGPRRRGPSDPGLSRSHRSAEGGRASATLIGGADRA